MINRKRIAVLLGTAEELYQEQFLRGFLAQAFDYDYDVCVFAMYQKFQESKTREVGETSIFYLVDYEKFDGVVLLLDTIQTPGMAKKIEETVKKRFSGPVLCVDWESEIFPWIEMEYYESAKKVISHLIEVHGYTDIAYVTGKEGHKHSTERLKAFSDCMKEHGLEIQEHRIFYGDYWYNGGEWMVEDVVKNGWKMPQAIACANDFMAIGAGKFLDKYGYRVPEDVALVGYDSVEEGKDSPKALTSFPIPRKQYGSHAARCLKALFDGRDFPKFDGNMDLFIGSSCGCHNESVVPKNTARDRWDTGMSSRDFFSLTNHMNADLLCQTNLYDLMKTLDYYTYHIREFDSFHICLNEDWNDFEKKALEGREYERYSPRMLHVLKCQGEDTKNDIISFDEYFTTDLMLPEIYEKRDNPTAFYFTTLHFEERSFGYAVVSYGDEVRSFNATYRMWLQSVMQELECFRRIEAIQKSNQKLEDSMIKDGLTGLHNYNGFVKQSDTMMRKIIQTNSSVGVLAVDIKELVKINDIYGRFEGDRSINTIARILEEVFPDGECVCLGNGEMLAVLLSEGDIEKELLQCYEAVLEKINKYNHLNERDYALAIYQGMECGKPQNKDELERLANVAISKKNGNKISERKNIRRDNLTEDERKEAKIVEELLNNNRFNYHFQPIVNAKNGEIFGYEALMRPDVDPYMAPPVVLKYAEFFDRLYDVEKATFFNILNIVCDKHDIFDGNIKVFINSIPGNLLHEEDINRLEKYAKKVLNTVVVELTEQMELEDEELEAVKALYERLGFQTAIDDYGTGYSNVTNLLRYMPNIVKIDRMLLSNIQESPQKQHFVKDIVTFSHDNNILTLAEGIETTEELQAVIGLDVDLIQGYYTAKPALEPVKSISKSIKNEIIECNKMGGGRKGRRVFVVGNERLISLARLVAEKYYVIELDNEETIAHKMTISGVPDLETDIFIRIKNGYQGEITLQNVTLKQEKHGPCIEIGNDCDVILRLEGENYFINGGIKVPASSKLTIIGDGDLQIKVDGANYYGIGNGIEAIHGQLIFEQDGTIEIEGSGMKGIGIGSGLGGEISIQRGKYIIRLMGHEGVGIGSFTGDIMPVISQCDMRVDISNAISVGVGSLWGDVQVKLDRLAWKGEFNADETVGIGTLRGKHASVFMQHIKLNMNLYATKFCGIGSFEGNSLVDLENGTLSIVGDGVEALSVGNRERTGKVRIRGGKIETDLKSRLESNLGARIEDVSLERAICQYTLNGERLMIES